MQWARCLALMLLICVAAAAQERAPSSSEALVSLLREGGHTIYFRHAATVWSQGDEIDEPEDWASCDPNRVRQLSEEGRSTARAVGDAMRALGIPIGRVLASPYCRTVETAKLMDVGSVESTTDVINMRVASYFGGRDAVTRRARALLATAPRPGRNTVVVSHGNVAIAATGVHPAEGEGLVLHPDGRGGFDVVGRLTPEQWQALARSQSTDGTAPAPPR